jgi:hypothetical protein
MTLTLPGLVVLIVIAAICGAVGKALAGGGQEASWHPSRSGSSARCSGDGSHVSSACLSPSCSM